MAEIMTTVGAMITEDKRGSYNSNSNDFVGENEITVTITLHEYRELVGSAFKKERDEAKSKLWDEQGKVRELEKKVEALTIALQNCSVPEFMEKGEVAEND